MYVNVHSAENAPGEVRGQLASTALLSLPMSGDNEVPAVTSAVSGFTYVYVDVSTQLLYYIYDLEVPDTSIGLFGGPGSHIHCGGPNTNGPVVAFTSVDTAPTRQFITDTNIVDASCGSTIGELFASLMAQRAYVNVHSDSTPDGEVRSGADGAIILEITLSGDQSVPAVSSTVSGVATLSVSAIRGGYQLAFVVNIDNPDGVDLLAEAGAHFHCGAPGTTGDVIAFLSARVEGGVNTLKSAFNGIIYNADINPTPCGSTVNELVS